MTEQASDKSQIKDIEDFDKINFLSPLEHDVLGSSVDIPLHGKQIKIAGFSSSEHNALTIEDLFREDSQAALTPAGLIKGINELEEIRNARRGKALRLTAFGLYGKEGIAGTRGVDVRLELSDVGEDRKISELRFKFTRGGEKINPKELGLEKWKMDEKYNEILQNPNIAEDGTLTFNLKKEYKPISNMHLVLAEHALIGSGMPYDGDKFFTGDKMVEIYEKEGRVPDIFLRPLSLNEGFSLEAVRQERLQRYITGTIAGFGEAGVDLYFDGFVPVIVLPLPDDKGQVEPVWKVFLIDVNTGKRVEDESALKKLQLGEDLLKVFDQKTEKTEITISVRNREQDLPR